MKVLLSSIGSRGDVQPILALATELKRLGADAVLCVAPNFKEWIESFGVECIPIGPDLRKMTGGTVSGQPALPSPQQLEHLAEQMLRNQFQVIGEAARGCDLLLAAGALQIATRSIAEVRSIPYVFAAYCPAVLPSSQYPPPSMVGHHSFSLPAEENKRLWEQDEQGFQRFAATLNEERAKLGLEPVERVRPYMFTDRPWLAADPALAPAASHAGMRAIVSRGWADLSASEAGEDLLSIGDVDHDKLFPRVGAVVHHGGSGTTTAAARAGKPQVIIPHNYDQFYWAHRVHQLGVGVSGPMRDDLSVDALVGALRQCLNPATGARAQALAGRIELHGARLAGQRLLTEFG
jgi:vancomycin aglycone glucosyltransferase